MKEKKRISYVRKQERAEDCLEGAQEEDKRGEMQI